MFYLLPIYQKQVIINQIVLKKKGVMWFVINFNQKCSHVSIQLFAN